ncbi:hypothetical protein CALVIDRAFT_594888 [Calocera viscosa TUFC12733]|uniref:DUF7918 domain-containing protein n=1 Tax=Calocera viscosa (strain TUFC12733) TaxID=1330018 RepID=A0A167R9M0_CALVF|nr:hypothetical protein CALVIDRAFT_594888 [Calocera viscosa TUFC12733]
MPSLRKFGVKAWIEVDGVKLDEYHVRRDSERGHVECWVASQEGKEFRVKWKCSYKEITRGCLKMDGRVVRRVYGGGELFISYMNVDNSTSARLKFGAVSVAGHGSDDIEEQDPFTAEIGTLQLKVETGIRLTEPESKKSDKSSTVTESNSQEKVNEAPVPDTAKKIGYHRLTAGETFDRRVPHDSRKSVFIADPHEMPWIFTFYYRPKEILEAHNISATISPRFTSGSQPSGKSVLSKLQAEEPPLEIDDTDEALDARLSVLRKEFADLEERLRQHQDKKLKRSASPAAVKKNDLPRCVFGKGEVIDLT